jgi:orotidine-5'-phosphate decarboxylase
MLEAASEARGRDLRVVGVTVLTSLAADDLAPVWGRATDSLPLDVIRLAELAMASRLDGVVSSVEEVASLRTRFGGDFLLVAPGIRLPGGDRGDQERVATPADAVRAGADYVVIGRTVTAARDPVHALEAVRADMADATSGRAR